MEYTSNYERWKETGLIEIVEPQIVEIWDVLKSDIYAQHEKLIQLRRIAGLNQQEFAEILGVTQSAISQWEKGAKKPSAETLIDISDLFSVDLKDFLIAFGYTFRN